MTRHSKKTSICKARSLTKTKPHHPLFSTSSLQNHGKTNYLLFEPPNPWYLAMAVLAE